MNKVNNILSQYDKLSYEEKILFFLELQAKDMREHYDPTYKKYRIEAKNFYGKLIVDRTLTFNFSPLFYNRREAEARAKSFLYEKGHKKYDERFEASMDERQLMFYRNESYMEITLTEE